MCDKKCKLCKNKEPNAETLAAMEEIERGEAERFESLEAMWDAEDYTRASQVITTDGKRYSSAEVRKTLRLDESPDR